MGGSSPQPSGEEYKRLVQPIRLGHHLLRRHTCERIVMVDTQFQRRLTGGDQRGIVGSPHPPDIPRVGQPFEEGRTGLSRRQGEGKWKVGGWRSLPSVREEAGAGDPSRFVGCTWRGAERHLREGAPGCLYHRSQGTPWPGATIA